MGFIHNDIETVSEICSNYSKGKKEENIVFNKLFLKLFLDLIELYGFHAQAPVINLDPIELNYIEHFELVLFVVVLIGLKIK